MRVKSEYSQMHKSLCCSFDIWKRILKYENETISKEESKNAMNSVISAVQTLVSKLLLTQRPLPIVVTMRNLGKKGPVLKI